MFRDVMQKGYLLVYTDDQVLISSTVDENIERLKIVLRTSANNGLNGRNVNFLKNKLISDYLGYWIEQTSWVHHH